MADVSNIENGVKLRYTGANGATIPFSAPSGATYEAGRNNPEITVRPEDVDWLLMRSFERADDESSAETKGTAQPEDVQAYIQKLEQELAQLRGYTVEPQASISTDPQEYPNNAVIRDPLAAETQAAKEGAAQDAATLEATADADSEQATRRGRKSKGDTE